MSPSLLYEALVKHSQNKVKFAGSILTRKLSLALIILRYKKNYVERMIKYVGEFKKRSI